MKRAVLKLFFILIGIVLFCGKSHATNSVFISQAGGGSGASCASPLAASYFNTPGNWSGTPTGTQIGPGTTVFLCGTITTNLTFQGSGSAGGTGVCGPSATACTSVTLDGSQSGAFLDAYIDLGQSYVIIQNITWTTGYSTGSSTQAAIQIAANQPTSFVTIQGNHMDIISSAQCFFMGNGSHDFLFLNNFFRNASPSGGDGFDTDVFDSEGSYNVTMEGNYMALNIGAGDQSCGGCHDDIGQLYTSGSGGATVSPYNWTFRYNYLNQMSSPTKVNNQSMLIWEGLGSGYFNLSGNIFQCSSSGSSGNGIVFDSDGRFNAGTKTVSIVANTIVENTNACNNLFNISTFVFTVQNNIVYNTDAGNMCTGGGCSTMTRGSNIWFGPNEPSCTSTTDLCSTNPLFTNFSTNDFSLQSGSPARSLGINLGTAFNAYPVAGTTFPNPTLGTRPGGSTAWDSGYTQFTGGGSVSLTPSSQNFGSVTVGSSSSNFTFTLTNTTAVTVTGISVSNVGGNTADFPNVVAGTTCTTTLAASSSCVYIVKFSPSIVGAESTTLTFTDSAGTQTSALSGTGVSAGAVTLTPNSHNFGSVANGTSSANFSFTLSNTTASTVTGITVTNVTGNTADFPNTGTGTCTTTLPASSSCTIVVKFTPSLVGTEATTLNVADSDSSSPQQSSLTGTGTAPTVTNLQVPTATKSITLTNANFNGNLTGWSPASCATYDGTKTHTADGSGSAKLVTCGSGTVTVLTSPTLTVDQTFSSLFIKLYIMADNAFNGTISFSLQDITHGNTLLNTTRGRNAKQIGPATGATTAWVLAQTEQLLNTYMHGGDKVQFSIKVTGQTAGTLWIDDLAFQESYYPIATFVRYPNYRGYLYASPDSQVVSGVTEFSPLNASQSALTIKLATVQYCTSGVVATITPTIVVPVTAWTINTTGLLTLNTPYYLCTTATINGVSTTYDYPANYTITPVSAAFKAALVNTFNTGTNAWEHNFGSGLTNTLLLGAFDSWSGANRTGSFGTGLFSSGGSCSPAQTTATLCYELNVNGMGTATPLSAPPVGLTGGIHGSALFTDYKTVNYNNILNFNAFSAVNPTTGSDQLTPYLTAMSQNSMTHVQIQNNFFGGLITGTILPSIPAAPTVSGTTGGSLSTGGGPNLFIKIAEVGMEPDAEPNLDYEKTQASPAATLAIGSNTAALITFPPCDLGASGFFVYAAQGATQPTETAFRRQFDDPYFPCNVPQVTLTTLIDSGDRTNSWDISSVTRSGSTVTVNIVQPTQLSCSANQFYVACIQGNASFTLSGITSSPNGDFNGSCINVTVVSTTQFTCSLSGTDTSGTGGLAQADETRSFNLPVWFARTTTDSSAWTTFASRMTGNTGAASYAPCDECLALDQDRVYKQKTFWLPAANDMPTLSYLFPMMLSFTGVREEADIIADDPYGYGFGGASDARWVLPTGDRSCTLYNTNNTTHTVAQCDVNLVDIWSEVITRLTYGSRPVVIIPQEWENGGFNGGPYAEMRRQAYKALLGCQIFGNLGCGFMWWQHGEISGMEDIYYRLHNTNAYTDLTTIDAEISGISSVWLSPSLDSSAPAPLAGFNDPGTGHIVSGVTMNSAAITQAATNTVCGFTGNYVNGQYANMTNYPFGPVRFVTKQPGGSGTTAYIMTTNLCEAPSSFTVTFSTVQAALPAGATTVTVLFESRTLPLTCVSGTCTFTDTWQDLDVHVYSIQPSAAPGLIFTPMSLNFGILPLYIPSGISQVQVTNTGSIAVTISSVAISGVPFALQTPAISPDCRTVGSIAAGGSCYFAVNATPAITGVVSGSVVMTDTAAGSPQTVPLSVTGLAVPGAPNPIFGGLP